MTEHEAALYGMAADAVYAQFSTDAFDPAAVRDALLERGFPPLEIDDFIGTYNVVAVSPPESESGMQAAVFYNTKTKEYVFSVRGTEPTSLKDILEDLTHVGPDGVASHQGIELLNWYQQLTAKQGEPIVIYGYESHVLGPDTLTYHVESAQSTGLLAGQRFTAVGHSLGGQLAILLSQFAGDQAKAVYSFNGPGFDFGLLGLNPGRATDYLTELQSIQLSLLGHSTISNVFDDSKINNIVVDGDLVHEVGNLPGELASRIR